MKPTLFIRSAYRNGHTGEVVEICHRPFSEKMRTAFYSLKRADLERMLGWPLNSLPLNEFEMGMEIIQFKTSRRRTKRRYVRAMDLTIHAKKIRKDTSSVVGGA